MWARALRYRSRWAPCGANAMRRQASTPGHTKEDLQALLEEPKVCQRLLSLARTDQELAKLFENRSEVRSPPAIQTLTNRQMCIVALNSFVPFFGFGFFDNFIMIIAGDALDSALCVTFGYSTMVAAALGNTFSDQIGLALGGVIETVAEKLGLPQANVTIEEQKMREWKLAHHGGSILGITGGCLLGMVPLLFLTSDADEKRLQKKVDEEICLMVEEQLAGMVSADRTSLFVYEAETNSLVMKVAKDLAGRIEVPLDGESFVARCFRSGHPINEHDMPAELSKFGYRMHSMLAVPLKGLDGNVGVVQMLNKKSDDTDVPDPLEGGRFTTLDERVAIRFAGMLAFVLQGYKGIAELPKILETERKWEAEENLRLRRQELVLAVLKDMKVPLAADRASLWLVEEGGDLYTLIADGTERFRCPVNKGIVGHVVQTGRSCRILDAYTHPNFNRRMDMQTGYLTKSVMVVPIFSDDGAVIGAIQVLNKRQTPGKKDTGFTEEDEDFAATIATQIGLSLASSETETSLVKRFCTIQDAQSEALTPSAVAGIARRRTHQARSDVANNY